MTNKKHSRDSVMSNICKTCGACCHSKDTRYSFVKLSLRPEPYKIEVESYTCLGCGPKYIVYIDAGVYDLYKDLLEEAFFYLGMQENHKSMWEIIPVLEDVE